MRKLLLLALSACVFSAFAQDGAQPPAPPAPPSAPAKKEMPAKKDGKKKHKKEQK